MKKRNFTIVELLTVIAIIGVLASIAYPAIGRAIVNARVRQAQTEIHNLVNAIKQYEATYGLLPCRVDSNANGLKIENDDYKNLVMALSQQKTKDGGFSESAVPTNMNLRKIPFLTPSTDFYQKGYCDPWGNRYVVILNSGYLKDGINHPKSGEDKLVGSVFVYSCGPNQEDNKGIKQGDSDDIASWAVK